MSKIIALMTDFGHQDTYVGVMKGVMLGICPDALMIDLTHMIEPQHIRQAAFALLNTYHYFPEGTVFLIVVDPGVGSERLPIAVRTGGYTFVAPDNGVLSYVMAGMNAIEAVQLANRDYQLPEVSQSFHGRDIFAPAAAYLAAGVALDAFGTRLKSITRLSTPVLTIDADVVTGEVVDIDRFGNIITNIGKLRWLTFDRLVLKPNFGGQTSIHILAKKAVVTLSSAQVSALRTSYSDVGQGEFLAMVGSNGYLEIAVNHGHAANQLGVMIGDSVKLSIGDTNAAIRN